MYECVLDGGKTFCFGLVFITEVWSNLPLPEGVVSKAGRRGALCCSIERISFMLYSLSENLKLLPLLSSVPVGFSQAPPHLSLFAFLCLSSLSQPFLLKFSHCGETRYKPGKGRRKGKQVQGKEPASFSLGFQKDFCWSKASWGKRREGSSGSRQKEKMLGRKAGGPGATRKTPDRLLSHLWLRVFLWKQGISAGRPCSRGKRLPLTQASVVSRLDESCLVSLRLDHLGSVGCPTVLKKEQQ